MIDFASLVSPEGLTRLRRFSVAAIVGVQLMVGVLAGGSVIGAFMVPGGGPATAVLPPAEVAQAVNTGAPMEIRIPSQKVVAPVVPIAMVKKTLDPPRDYLEVGWWIASAKPGALQGQVVITGHTLHYGDASMNNIGDLTKGQAVDIVTKYGTMRYRVTKSDVLTKKQVVKRSDELFAQDHGDGRLVLITCSDWNGSEFETNTVVFAQPQGAPAGASAIPTPSPTA